MSYVIQAVLSNAQHPEYGQVTIPFPIPNQNYDCTIELLEPLEIGDTLRQDCQVDELDSFYTVLNALIGTQVTLDELDYLAKRLDSFDDGEAAQFQGMAHKLGLSKIKDLINLTFCCQKATVITDFSDLEKIGREHYMNLNGGCARTEDLEALDGTETAYLLIDSGAGTVTPYGVAYDNSMKLEPLYNGRQFPEYLYDNSSMGLKIVPAENQAPELLWLPASEQQIRRTLLRAGWQDPDHADYTIDVFLLQKEAGRIRAFSDAQRLIANLNATPSSQTRYQIYETQIDDAKRKIEKFNQLKAALYGDFADGLLSHQDYTDLSEDYSRRADDLRIFIAELEKEKEKYSVGFGSKMQWALLIEKYKDQESLDAEMAAAFIETLTLFNDGHVEVAFRHRDEIEQVLYVAATRGKEAERYAG